MNWNDLRFVLALSRAGSLSGAAKALGVDHTTVGRRVDALEAALSLRLFTRSRRGIVPTADAERLLDSFRRVEEAVHAVERSAQAQAQSLEGTVRITSPETFGVSYLAPRLAHLGRRHPGLTLELLPVGDVLDLAKREADIALRGFRSNVDGLVVRRAGTIKYGLYAAEAYLAGRELSGPEDLREHPILSPALTPGALDAQWVQALTRGARPALVSELSLALLEGALAGAGIAVLPRYLGDAHALLRYLPMPDEPKEAVWIHVHDDVRDAPRVRVVLDFLAETMKRDRSLLLGRRPTKTQR
ncbi:MAG: LysR family transcriptional regulator [Sandaracinaceae bacterium]